MSWLEASLAIVAAALPAGGAGTGWRDPVALRARPLLDAPAAVRPALAGGPTGVTALAFVADTTRGARMAVALRPPGASAFLTPRTLAGTPDLNDAGGRAPAIAAGPRGAFAVAWLGGGREARRTPAVVVSIRRPGHGFGVPHQVSRTGGRPLAAPPAVAMDARGATTVAWTERRGHGRRVVVVRIAPGRLPTRGHQLAAGRSVGPPAAAESTVAWAQGGRLRLSAARGAPASDAGAATTGRAPALAATAGRLAMAWQAPGALVVRDPGGLVTRTPLDGTLAAGPLLGLDAAGQTTVAWQDARGVLGLVAGGRPQLVGSLDQDATLSTLSVAADGRSLVTFLGSGAGHALVHVAARPAGAGFLAPVTLSRPGPITSLAAAAAVPGGADVVAWASSIGAPGAGLLLVAVRPRGTAPPANAPATGLIA